MKYGVGEGALVTALSGKPKNDLKRNEMTGFSKYRKMRLNNLFSKYKEEFQYKFTY